MKWLGVLLFSLGLSVMDYLWMRAIPPDSGNIMGYVAATSTLLIVWGAALYWNAPESEV